ncbi:serine hydrolase domain-containing protein [Flavobacterium pedocola]
MKKTGLLLILSIALSGFAQENTRFRKIDSLLTYLNNNNKFMGQVSIREGDNVVFSRAYGLPKSKVKPDGYTKYKIGSVTKTFTAVMILQLVEERKLKLDSKLARFYPKIPNASKITINDLLRHRSGIRDYLNVDAATNGMTPVSQKEMIARIAGYQPVFEPNSKAEYSNSNYYLLGCIIENITKTDYKTNLKNRIVNRLKLQDTYLADKIDLARNEAYSYIYDGTKWNQIPEWNMSMAYAAGGITSNANDLTALLNGIFNGKLLKQPSIDEMIQLNQSYGIGLITFSFGERKFYGHNGEIEGYKSVVGYYPKEKMGISLLVNGDNYNRNDIMIGILSIYYKMPYPFPNLTSLKIDENILKNYTGVYSSKDLPLKITVKIEKGELIAQATGQSPFPLNAISNTEFTFDSAGLNMIFGDKTMLLKQGGMEFKFIKD